jgi:DNA-binding transcriptional LysR family regulator
MELRHLRYFVAVAEELNFSRAAERLHIAQPPLSKQIRDLETELGVRLFNRNNVRVALTDAGRVFLEDALEILDRVDRAVTRTREASRGILGQLRVGTIGKMTMPVLPKMLAKFREGHPEVEVSTAEMNGDEQVRALRHSEIDVGFTGRIMVDTTGLERLHIARFPLAVVVPDAHGLAKKRAVRLRDLKGEPLVCLSLKRVPAYIEWIKDLFHSEGLEPVFSRSVDTVEAALSMVAAGYGVAVLPKAEERPADEGYKVIPLEAERSVFDLYAVWVAANESAILQNFLAQLRAETRPA